MGERREQPLAVGTKVRYFNKECAWVLGVVDRVYTSGQNAEADKIHELLQSTEMFAYRLHLPEAVAEAVGHPVCVRGGRLVVGWEMSPDARVIA
jgi:hypothetical protein